MAQNQFSGWLLLGLVLLHGADVPRGRADEAPPKNHTIDLSALAREAVVNFSKDPASQEGFPAADTVWKNRSQDGGELVFVKRDLPTGYFDQASQAGAPDFEPFTPVESLKQRPVFLTDRTTDPQVVKLQEVTGRLDRSLLNGREQYTLVAWVRRSRWFSIPVYRELTVAGEPRFTVLLTARQALRYGIYQSTDGDKAEWTQGLVKALEVPVGEWFQLAIRLKQHGEPAPLSILINGREHPVDGGTLRYPATGETLLGSSHQMGSCEVGQLLLFPRPLERQELAALRKLSEKHESLSPEAGKLEVALADLEKSPPTDTPAAAELKAVGEFIGPQRSINRVRFMPDGRSIVAVSDDPKLWVWDVPSGFLRNAFPIAPLSREVCVSPDGRLAAVGGKKDVELYSLEDGKRLRTLSLPGGECHGIVFTPDGRFVIFCQGSTLTKQNLETFEYVAQAEAPHATTRSLGITPDGNRLITAANDGLVVVWDAKTFLPLTTFRGHVTKTLSKTYDADITPDQRFAVSCSEEPSLHLWDVETGAVVRSMVGHEEGIKSVRFLADGKRIVSGGYDATLRMWDAETGRQTWIAKGLGSNHVAVSPDGRHVAAGGGYISRTVATPELESLKITLFEVPADVATPPNTPTAAPAASK